MILFVINCRKNSLHKEPRVGKRMAHAEKKRPAASVKNSIGMQFMLIPPCEPRTDQNEYTDEGAACEIAVSKPFYLGKYPVTQMEWKEVMGSDPSCFEGDDRPVECVSWKDVLDFIRKLNENEGTGKYRLPTEDEWEYACRAGTTTRYSFGDADSELGEYAWYYRNSGHGTHPVGQKKPNPWGLYDMHGNVWEWCYYRYHEIYEDSLADASSWVVGSVPGPVLRGGSWVNYPKKCRSSYSIGFHPNYGHYSLGFRLVRSV
jgi:formylglycine-generating enzyme required for sulfatase activity